MPLLGLLVLTKQHPPLADFIQAGNLRFEGLPRNPCTHRPVSFQLASASAMLRTQRGLIPNSARRLLLCDMSLSDLMQYLQPIPILA